MKPPISTHRYYASLYPKIVIRAPFPQVAEADADDIAKQSSVTSRFRMEMSAVKITPLCPA